MPRLHEIWEQITEAQAEGFKGIAIKSAVNDNDAIAAVYESAVRLSDGVDIVAQIKRW